MKIISLRLIESNFIDFEYKKFSSFTYQFSHSIMNENIIFKYYVTNEKSKMESNDDTFEMYIISILYALIPSFDIKASRFLEFRLHLTFSH